MPAFSNIVSIAKSFSTLAGAIEDASKVFDILTGNDGMSSIVAAIGSLDNVFSQGMAQVVTAVNNSTYQEQWSARILELESIQAASLPLLEQLATLTPTHRIVQAGVEMPLVRWCETGVGNGLESGALTILSSQLSILGNLFLSGGSSADPPILTIWQRVCQAAAANGMPGFVGQTQYTLTLQLMQQVYGMVGSMVFAHESALALYKADNPANPHNFVSLRPLVSQLFGNVSTANTVWNAFAGPLASAIAPGEPAVQYGACMTSCDNGSAATPFTSTAVLGNQDFQYTAAFYASGVQLIAPAGTYFGGLRLQVEPAFNEMLTLDEAMLYLQAMPVTIGPNLAMNPGSWMGSAPHSVNVGFILDNPPVSGVDLASNPAYVMQPDGDNYAYFNTSYAQPPLVSGPNRYAVITGFQMVSCYGNRIGLAVQYSTLDLSAPDSPTLSEPTWVQPNPEADSFFAIGGWDNWGVTVTAADTRPAGTTDYFPATNATIVASRPTVQSSVNESQGTYIGVALQNSLPLHTLPWLQADASFGPGAPAVAKTATP
ncbi:hypothetical protein [Longimicrobium sp.]|uniref:hypothetical protein n=1 Tax=Longimicrobium sp. TaxID=2029185 RepID=UPI002BCBDA1D|nr:hypothetical protein [Longimicrobium sp.]HSU16161.1 hypothetical protein [Longimicrobium sp.]